MVEILYLHVTCNPAGIVVVNLQDKKMLIFLKMTFHRAPSNKLVDR